MTSARYAVGVDLGTTYTCAAVASDGAPRVVQLTGTSNTIPSVVSKTDDGMLAGEAAERRLTSHPAATAREFKRRFGDPAPLVLAGETFGADALTAELLSEVLRRVETAEGNPPAAVALSHPASWGPFRLDLLRDAATQAGVDDVQLIPEPVAAAVANSDRVTEGSLVAVYDLGGGTFDAAVVRCEGDWSVVGTPEGVERLGGIDFDQAVLAHVDAALDGQVFTLDSGDPDARSALMQLRSECQAAKEHLSQDTDVEIPVALPSLRTTVRLTRNEFEAMVRPRLADSLSVLDRVVASAGVEWDEIDAVLLVGGSSNIPAVGQLVGEHTGRPVISATNPHLAIALGTAAIAQRDVVRPAAAVAAAAVSAGAVASSAPVSAGAVPDAAPPDEASGKGPNLGLIVAGVIAVLAVIAGFFVLSGGGDDDAASPGVTEPSGESVAPATDPAEESPPATDPPSSDTTAPAPDTTVATGAVAITVCADDAAGSLRMGGTESGLFIATETDLRRIDVSAVEACSIDVGSAAPVDAGQLEPVTEVSGFDNGLALSGASSGVVNNLDTGNVLECAGLTGPSAIDGDRGLNVLNGDVVERYELDQATCQPVGSSTFDDIAATHIAAGGSERLAIAGTSRSTGTLGLWVFNGPGDVVVLEGFTTIDGVARCGEQWCVLDVGANRVHLVDLDGVYMSATNLDAALPASVTEVLDTATMRGDSAYALVALADERNVIIQLTP